MKFSRVALSVCVALVVSGCTVKDEVQKNISGVKQDMTLGGAKPDEQAHAAYVSRPPIDLTVINATNKPGWTSNRVPAINASNMPFSMVAGVIANAGGVAVQMADVNPNTPVTVSIPAGVTVDSAMSALSSASGYTPDIQDHAVVWRDMIVRVYDLKTPAGKVKYSLGKDGASQNSSGGGSGTETEISLNSASSQYSNVAADYDLFNDTLNSLKLLVGKKGVVTGSGAQGLITVQSKGSAIQLADAYMEKFQASIRRQVQLRVKLLTFKSNRGSNYGVDWNLVYKAGDGKIGFDTNNLGTFTSTQAPAKLSLTATGGSLDGSSILINALQEQGDVTVVTEPSGVIGNNRVGEIEVTQKTRYTDSVKTTPNQNADASTETVKGSYNEGYTLFALPKITEDGEIFLHVTSELSSLVAMNTQQVNEITQSNPTVSNSRFTQTMRLKSGETWIINGYKQSLNQDGDKSTFGIPAFGGQTTASKNTVETIVLITPTIIN